MEKKTIVLIIITVILFLILVAGVCYGFFFSGKENIENDFKEVSSENVTERENMNLIGKMNTATGKFIQEEKPEEPKNVPDTTNQVIGKEEAESANENVGMTEAEKAIEIAKEKWGKEDTSVTYAVANHTGNTYVISVTNKETTAVMAWYQVDMTTGKVVE